MKKLRIATIAIVFVSAFALSMAPAWAQNPHFVGTPTCRVVNGGTAVECTGKVAGIGTAPTTVSVSVNFECTNRGGHNPPGQASGQSGPIVPRGGQITFDVTTSSASCPDYMTPSFGRFATLTLTQLGVIVFQDTIRIT